jgi:HPr kinase/phosphorylase
MNASSAGRSITVAQFLEAGAEDLGLSVAAGEKGLRRTIREVAINRPGLALTGFFEYFAHRRLQVLGLAEYTYLASLPGDRRLERLRSFFDRKIPCVVITRGKRVLPELMVLADEFRIPVLRTGRVTKQFINAATLLMENLVAPRTKVQGTMVEIMGVGVLIEGPPGVGKSDTALGLIKQGHALVSDDVTALRIDSNRHLIASPVSITRYHMEIRGLGIIHVPSLFGVSSVRQEKMLDLVVSLAPPGGCDPEDRGGEPRRLIELLGIKVPQVCITVRPGRDLANIVEAAALDIKLKRLGHDAEKELDERLMSSLLGSKAGCE